MEQMVKALEGALERSAGLIAQADATKLGNPTPCHGWDVRGLLTHIVGGAQMFSAIARGEEFKPASDDPIGDDPSGAFLAAKQDLLAAFSDPAVFQRTFTFPFGALPAPAGIGIMLMETFVHGWDLAKGIGVDAEIDPMVAGMILDGARMAISPGSRNADGNPFGPEVSVPDSATPTEKLVAFLGRTP